MRVRVDESGRRDLARGIDLALAFVLQPAERRDATVRDGDVRLEARRTRTVDDRRIADEEGVFQQPAFRFASTISRRCESACSRLTLVVASRSRALAERSSLRKFAQRSASALEYGDPARGFAEFDGGATCGAERSDGAAKRGGARCACASAWLASRQASARNAGRKVGRKAP